MSRAAQLGTASVAAGLALLVAILPTLAPSPTNSIDIDRAISHVEEIASEPHVMGTPEAERVRAYLLDQIASMGLEPETQTVQAPDYFGHPDGTVEITNVIARIEGADSGDAVLFIAHYDTVPGTPGANDNTAAVAALLEVGRVLTTQTPPHDVVILFTDGEEPTPRFGASAFVEHRWFSDVRLAVNFEGIGTGGPSTLIEMHGPASDLVPHLAAAPNPVAYSFMAETAALIGGAATDFDVFKANDVPGYSFAYLRGSSVYHTNRDAPASLNLRGMAHHAETALAIAAQSGIGEFQSDDDAGVVFFLVPGGGLVHYPAIVASLLAFVAVGGAGLALARRGGSRGWSEDLLRLARGVGTVVGASIVTTAVWVGVFNLRPNMGLGESYAWLTVLVVLAGLLWYLDDRHQRTKGVDPARSTLIVWVLPATATSLWLPEMSPLFVWPLLACAIALAIRPRSKLGELAAFTAVSLVSLVMVVPAIDLFFQLATPRPGNPGSELPATVAVPMLLVALTFALVGSVWPRNATR